jgi:hypothetical protein
MESPSHYRRSSVDSRGPESPMGRQPRVQLLGLILFLRLWIAFPETTRKSERAGDSFHDAVRRSTTASRMTARETVIFVT